MLWYHDANPEEYISLRSTEPSGRHEACLSLHNLYHLSLLTKKATLRQSVSPSHPLSASASPSQQGGSPQSRALPSHIPIEPPPALLY